MKAQDRKAILNELQKLKATSINSESTKVPVNDGYTQTIRIGDFWISAGPSFQMSSEDRQRFGEVYGYLEGYTLRKASPR